MSYSKIKLPYPEINFFENLIRILPSQNVKIFSLKKEDRIIVCLVAFIYKDCLSAYYIGTDGDEEVLKMRPVDLFYWEVIKWGNENKCKTFDWMGAGKPNVSYGVRKFKLQFGGNVVSFGRFEKNHKPHLMQLAKAGLKLYKIIK
jgi:lipid II:glycine glycyltransferase (peptidoglycan interpeptide bridge formation enzyme)